jgi:hypothetical protein
MGYVTRYHLSVVAGVGSKSDYDKWVNWIENLQGEGCPVDGDSAVAFRIDANEHFGECYMEIPVSWLYDFWIKESDRCKWYRHETDMKSLSRHFPALIFMLEGEGEETKDLWIKYFKNGKMQACPGKITYDEYDPNKLE